MLSKTLISVLAISASVLAMPSPMEKRFDLKCGDNGGGYRPVGEAQNCVDYLNNKGNDDCRIDGENGIFCRAGETVITGSNISGKDSASSYCKDVATAAQRIIDSCTTPEQTVAGADAAQGNGELIVSINWG